MERTIRAATQMAITDAKRTSHLTRHAAISPAVTIVQKPSVDFFSISAAISSPTKVENIATPIMKASADRPKDGSWCSARASGGPIARAPHEGQPRQRSTEMPEPQEGQIIKLSKPLEK